MMFALAREVIPDALEIRMAPGKNAVAILPCKIGHAGRLEFDPFRRRFFDILDHFADGNCPSELE